MNYGQYKSLLLNELCRARFVRAFVFVSVWEKNSIGSNSDLRSLGKMIKLAERGDRQ